MPTTNNTAVFCEECHCAVRLERIGKYGQLTLACACGHTRSVKVKEALPEVWQE